MYSNYINAEQQVWYTHFQIHIWHSLFCWIETGQSFYSTDQRKDQGLSQIQIFKYVKNNFLKCLMREKPFTQYVHCLLTMFVERSQLDSFCA